MIKILQGNLKLTSQLNLIFTHIMLYFVIVGSGNFGGGDWICMFYYYLLIIAKN